MSAVCKCHEITKELLEAVQRTDREREELIALIDRLLDEREDLLPAIQPPFTKEEARMGKQILVWNRLIDARLAAIRSEIQRDIQGAEKKRVSVNK
ncbi:MAG TPA: hypothetical protein VEY51_21205 [Chondromyces sp.]|nr:hypothetical protein [Chondromyces sp.]